MNQFLGLTLLGLVAVAATIPESLGQAVTEAAAATTEDPRRSVSEAAPQRDPVQPVTEQEMEAVNKVLTNYLNQQNNEDELTRTINVTSQQIAYFGVIYTVDYETLNAKTNSTKVFRMMYKEKIDGSVEIMGSQQRP